MAKLLGRAPNQVPTNADLGTMAFQDREGINVNNAIVANLVVTGSTSVNAPFGVVNSTANALYVATNGYVGIGTNSPSQKLDVYGNARFVSSGAGDLTISHSSMVTSLLTAPAVALTLGANNLSTVRLTTAGYVGINNVVPTDTLSVNGSIQVTNSTTNGILTVAANGNIGINSNAPSYKFVVQSGGGQIARIYDTGASWGGIGLASGPGTDFVLGKVTRSGSYNSFQMQTNVGTALVTVDEGGNTGIGNTAPNAKLQVTGTANVSGNVVLGQDVTVVGNLTVSGTTTYINTTTLNVGDNIVALNADVTGSPTENAGIEVNRGTSSNTSWLWNESRGRWGAYPVITTGTHAGIEAYGNSASVAAIGQGNSTSNTTSTIYASEAVATMTLDSRNSTNPTSRTSYIELSAPDYRGAGMFVTQVTAPMGGSNSYWWVGKPYTGGGFQIGYGTGPEYQSNAVFFVSSANSNIGIGTVSPTDVLHVRRDSTGNTGIIIQNRDAAGIASLKFLTGALDVADSRYAEIVSSGGSSSSLTFRTSNGAAPANVMFLAANGNVGIGNTTPTDKLVVNGNANVQGRVTAYGGGTNSAIVAQNTATGAYLQITPSAGAGSWSNFTSAGDVIILASNNTQNNGNLVIGTWSSFGNPGYGHGIKLTGNTYDVALGGSTISFSNGSTTTAIFAANGNHGIGNTAPASRLVVQGVSADGNTAAGIAVDVLGAAIRVGDGAGTAQTFANGVGFKIADNGSAHYTVGQIGGKLVISDSSNDGNALYPATRTDIISANSTNVTIAPALQISSYVNYSGAGGQQSVALVTSTTTANQVVFTSGTANWRAVKFVLQITSGSVYQATEITLLHDGTNVYKSEYGQVYTGASLATFDADINTGNMRLLITPVNAATTIRGVATLMAV